MDYYLAIDPATGKEFAKYQFASQEEISQKLEASRKVYSSWKNTDIRQRVSQVAKLAEVLRLEKLELGKLITQEMGKPISQSYAEIEKCAVLCEYYAENAEAFLADEYIESDASTSFVHYEPVGTVLGIMPWNFPVWQVMRFAVPAIIAGNCAMLKHSPNVFGTADYIETLFIKAGFPESVFINLNAHTEAIPEIIANDTIATVSVTASEATGSKIGELAGKNIKKSVLELGGSDAFIVRPDADFDSAVKTAATSRLFNSGQTCISAKRFFVPAEQYSVFADAMKAEFEKTIVGDPMNEETQVGPMARKDLLEQIDSQVQDSIDQGAECICGGKCLEVPGYFYAPTILTNVTPDMPVFKEETFGAVAAIIPYSDEAELVDLVNSSRYGLAASIFGTDSEKAQTLAYKLDVGHVAINGMVKSDPRLPFGGIKKSGYGNELAKLGLMEFVNAKTIWVG